MKQIYFCLSCEKFASVDVTRAVVVRIAFEAVRLRPAQKLVC